MTSSSNFEPGKITIPTDSVVYCEQLARRYAPSLKTAQEVAGATLRYHLGADALAWSDELPTDLVDLEFRRFYVVLLQLRTRAILGDIDPNGSLVLDTMRDVAPGWAFCQQSRFSSDLSELYFSLREAS